MAACEQDVIDINWYILEIFQQGQFNDISTFIMRVLYSIIMITNSFTYKDQSDDQQDALAISIICKSNILKWCKDVYDRYFKPETIPLLYTTILLQLQIVSDSMADSYRIVSLLSHQCMPNELSTAFKQQNSKQILIFMVMVNQV